MNPALFAMLIPIVALMIPIVAMLVKHRERMATLEGTGGAQPEAVRLLTETLERQHERQTALQKRVETLEAAMIERDLDARATSRLPAAPATGPRLTLPDAEPPSPVAAPDATRVRA